MVKGVGKTNRRIRKFFFFLLFKIQSNGSGQGSLRRRGILIWECIRIFTLLRIIYIFTLLCITCILYIFGSLSQQFCREQIYQSLCFFRFCRIGYCRVLPYDLSGR